MRLIPVLDLKGGLVVRGVGGRRNEYRPVESVVARSADPIDVAVSLREHFGFHEFYIADLDAIAGAQAHAEVVSELARRDFALRVDAGLRDVECGRTLLNLGATRVIAALETSPGPEQLRALVESLGADRVTFSVDLRGGALMTAGDGWRLDSAFDVAQRVLECGVQSLILLDLAGVGEGRGVPTLGLCREVRAIAPHVEIITGGGVRDVADLESLERASADGVLVASALHNGALTPSDGARWSG